MTTERLCSRIISFFENAQRQLHGCQATITCELMVHPGYRCQGLGGCGDPCGPDDFACSGEREHELEILNSDKLKEFYLKQNFKLYPTILWDNTYWTYPDRLKRVNLHSLELRRLYMDLYYCYKMLFGLVDIKVTDFFEWTPHHNRGHNFQLYNKSLLCESDPPF